MKSSPYEERRPVLQHVDGGADKALGKLNPSMQVYPLGISQTSFMRYRTALLTWPPTGTGQRLVHRHILRLARLSRVAGRPPAQAELEICDAMRSHSRLPHPGEIREALETVWQIALPKRSATPSPTLPSALQTFKEYAEEGLRMGFSESDLLSPDPSRMPGSAGALHIGWEPGWLDAAVFLLALFKPEDWVLCLPRNDVRAGEDDVRRRDDWCVEFARRGEQNLPLPAFVLPNPVRAPGNWALNASGLPSPRVKGSLAAYRHFILDRDKNPLHDRRVAVATQISFLGGWGMRFGWELVRAVVHTGNKSLHVVMDVNVQDEADWDEKVARGILPEFVRLGFDGSFARPAQLCRLPGAWRRLEDHQLEEGDKAADGTVPEAKRWKRQRLLFVKGELQ